MPPTTCECCEDRYSGRRKLLKGEKKKQFFFFYVVQLWFDLDNITLQNMSTEFIESEFPKNRLEESHTLLKGGNE